LAILHQEDNIAVSFACIDSYTYGKYLR